MPLSPWKVLVGMALSMPAHPGAAFAEDRAGDAVLELHTQTWRVFRARAGSAASSGGDCSVSRDRPCSLNLNAGSQVLTVYSGNDTLNRGLQLSPGKSAIELEWSPHPEETVGLVLLVVGGLTALIGAAGYVGTWAQLQTAPNDPNYRGVNYDFQSMYAPGFGGTFLIGLGLAIPGILLMQPWRHDHASIDLTHLQGVTFN